MKGMQPSELSRTSACYHDSSTPLLGNLVLIETGHGQNYFLTNDEDQNSVACEMPTTLTVTYAVIVACVIETRTVFRPARS